MQLKDFVEKTIADVKVATGDNDPQIDFSLNITELRVDGEDCVGVESAKISFRTGNSRFL